jgi:DNA-directed RNA polymerase sigma subunit (sigma70/sigma32)
MSKKIEAAIEETLRRLSPREQDIVRRRFVLGDRRHPSLRQSGGSRAAECRILLRALRHLRLLSRVQPMKMEYDDI